MSNEEIRELIQLVYDTGLAELEVQRGENRVRIRRAFETSQTPVAPPQAAPAPAAKTETTVAKTDPQLVFVKSPIVGTFYEASAPGTPPFVRIGDQVAPGKVICIIESMKLMNPIEAEVAGVIESKLVQNGQAVEYGEALLASGPFKKILIANRGEIALRIICACKDLGIPAVVVYSEADRDSLPVRFADEAICIGPAKSARSYLDIASIVSAAAITHADAIHPGYGFLSENPRFAEVCRASNIKFIGPAPEIIAAMGIKERARAIMQQHGVPILPGSPGLLSSADEALDVSEKIGYPVILKASAGGGGRGMRVVRQPDELPALLSQAQQEAGASFSSPDVYLEKYVEAPRHIEFQILADEHGHVEILGERDCSIQRRHQKLLEESPSPALRPEVRERVSTKLREAIRAIGYSNAGTAEFVMDEKGDLSFIEVNARIQVEHPVTEAVIGIDLVKAQIRIAGGEKLSDILDGPVAFHGHAIECRINAENPETFAPSPGRITRWNVPGGIGIRVDTHAFEGCVIPPYYDSLVAKLIAHGRDRAEAIRRMRRALDLFVVEGIYTSIPLHKRILNEPDFVAGRFDTNFIKRWTP